MVPGLAAQSWSLTQVMHPAAGQPKLATTQRLPFEQSPGAPKHIPEPHVPHGPPKLLQLATGRVVEVVLVVVVVTHPPVAVHGASQQLANAPTHADPPFGGVQ